MKQIEVKESVFKYESSEFKSISKCKVRGKRQNCKIKKDIF